MRVTYRLTPAHTVSGLTFRGDLGLDDGELRRTCVDRFGAQPARRPRRRGRGGADGAAARLRLLPGARHDRRWRPTPSGAPRCVSTSPPAAAPASAQVSSPPRAAGAHPRQLDLEDRRDLRRAGASSGGATPCAPGCAQGYYEAGVVRPTPAARAGRRPLVDIAVDVEPGPLVSLRFEGDPIPEARRAELVPVQREATVDEDLLEDSKRRIEAWLRSRDTGRREPTIVATLPTAASTLCFRSGRRDRPTRPRRGGGRRRRSPAPMSRC